MRHSGTLGAIVLAESNAADLGHIAMVLSSRQYDVKIASDPNALRQQLSSAQPIHAVVLGSLAGVAKSVDLLRDLRQRDPDIPVIVILESGIPQDIAEALKCGAIDVLVKPVDGEALCSAVRHAVAVQHRPAVRRRQAAVGLVGRSLSMQHLISSVRRVGSSDAPVLIQGETGVGKEVLARELHALSPRAGRPFLKVNCAALPSELIESELFGYNRGAFTGAAQNKPGLFERADTGAILLDEIGDVDLRFQAKLLQVLQDLEFYRVGGREKIRVNVRVIAATQADLETAVETGAFRADLYYRLNVISLRVPPLRERREDILPLTGFLIERHSEPGAPAPPVTRALEEALLNYDWPGNIRELENVVRKLLIFRTPALLIAELKDRRRQMPQSVTYPAQVESVRPGIQPNVGADAEVEAITAALEAARWNRKAAASLLGIGYKGLLYKMKKLGIADVDAPIIRSNRTLLRRAGARSRGADG